MKQKNHKNNLKLYKASAPMYPNAADTNYIARKLLDIATALVSGMGLVTAMIFLITLA